MTNNGNLIEIPDLKLVISDNLKGKFDDGFI